MNLRSTHSTSSLLYCAPEQSNQYEQMLHGWTCPAASRSRATTLWPGHGPREGHIPPRANSAARPRGWRGRPPARGTRIVTCKVRLFSGGVIGELRYACRRRAAAAVPAGRMDGAVVALAGHSPHTAEVAARAFAPTTPQGSSHCAPLPPLAGQNTPADAWERQLNLSPEYLSSVSGFGSLRELVQNWHDECQRHLGGAPSVSRHENEFARITLLFAPGPARPAPCAGYLLEWRDGAGGFSVQLTNFNTVLKPKILGLGTSEKSGAAAGCFGEGMKVEINRLVARGVGVVVFTGGSRWDFGYRTSEQQGSTLVACATASHFCGHTSFLVSGAEATFAAQLPAAGLSKVDENEFLFLNPPADPAHMKGDLLEVLLEERFYGSLYVNGILVLKDPLVPEFGLNFVGPKTFYPALGFGRDRNVIRAEQLVKLLPWTFYKLADKAHRAKLAFRLCQVLYKHETSQLRHLFGSGAPIKYESDAQETAVQQLLADELVEQFIGNFGLKAFPLNTADASPEEQKQAEYISATPVIVNCE
jgi:hypothetical protein